MDGRSHARATGRNVALTVGTTLGWCAARVWYGDMPAEVGFAVGQVIGHYLTPDIDHHWLTHEERRILQKSKLLGWLWIAYWHPYQLLHSHRGISHWPVVGTVGRFVYLLWPFLLLSVGLGMWFWAFWLWVFTGWLMQDQTHLSLDRS